MSEAGSARGRHVVAGGIRLHYLEFPNANPPLVVVPGITMTAANWAFVGERLAEFAHVFVLDPRGRGLSEHGRHLAHGLDDHAGDVAALVRALGIDRADVLGHSMGARITIRLAARHPGSVGSLVLVDPPMTGPGRRPYPTPLSAFLDGIAQASRGEGRAAMQQSLGWSDAQIDLRMQWLPTCEPHAVEGAYRSFVDEDVHADMPAVRARTLFLYAQLGGTVTDDEAREVGGLLRSAEVRRIDGAGHMIPWDRLEPFVDAVRGFLRCVPR
jgi:N-formylmaleamate deformylase